MRCLMRLLAVLVAVGLLASLVVGCGCGSVVRGTDDPEETVRGALEAVEARDAERWASYFVGGDDDLVQIAEDFFGTFETIEISIEKIEVVSQTEDLAEVAMVYKAEMEFQGQMYPQDVDAVVEVVKVDGMWLIKEAF
jgi:hypothetical protein